MKRVCALATRAARKSVPHYNPIFLNSRLMSALASYLVATRTVFVSFPICHRFSTSYFHLSDNMQSAQSVSLRVKSLSIGIPRRSHEQCGQTKNEHSNISLKGLSNEKDDGSFTRNIVVCSRGSIRQPNDNKHNSGSGMRHHCVPALLLRVTTISRRRPPQEGRCCFVR